MSCEYHQKRNATIEAYISGQLSPEERERFDQHVFECDACFEDLAFRQEVAGLVKREGDTLFAAALKMEEEKADERKMDLPDVRSTVRGSSFPQQVKRKPIRWLIPAAIALALLAMAPFIIPLIVQWTAKGGGKGVDEGAWKIAIDQHGNSIITGKFEGEATIGSQSLRSGDNGDAFLAKYDSSGNFLWARQVTRSKKLPNQSGHNIGFSVVADHMDNIFVTGEFLGEVTFDTVTHRSVGANPDLFIAKYDKNGNMKWVQVAGGSYSITGFDAAVDFQGNCIITGNFGHHNLGGSCTFGDTTLQTFGGNDIFVAKIDPLGKFLWVKQAGADTIPGADVGQGIAVDASGNITIAGRFSGTAVFDSTALKSEGEQDIFLARYSPHGILTWVKRAGGKSREDVFGVTTDLLSNIIMTGYFTDTATFDTTQIISNNGVNVFVAKYDSQGNVTWVRQTTGNSDNAAGQAITVDFWGNIFVIGHFSNSLYFSEMPFYSRGGLDIFVAKYFPDGMLEWAHQEGGTGDDVGHGIAITSPNQLFITGSFQDTLILGETTLVSKGGSDFFIARLSPKDNQFEQIILVYSAVFE